MKKVTHKILSLLLAVILLFGSAPLAALEGLDFSNIFGFRAEAANYSGTCGENLTWTLDTETGELVISGTGDMISWNFYDTPWYDYRLSIKTLTIGSGVTSIGEESFCECENLTSVTIPNTVTRIDYRAFASCSKLTDIIIPDSVTVIGESSFSFCDSLASVVIGNSVKTIGYNAFEDCDSLTNVVIGNSVVYIGEYAFYDCDALTGVTISSSVTDVYDHAFGSCDSLAEITVDDNNPNLSSDNYGVLFNKDKTVLIQYPLGNERTSYTVPDTVTLIKEWAFSFCSSLTSITIPNSVNNIGYGAFSSCSNLTNITIPDSVTGINSGAFDETAYYCNESNWENGVLYIGNHLIEAQNATISSEYTIKSGTVTIADYAFRDCSVLTDITIPDSVTNIGAEAFSGTAYYDNESNWKNGVLYIGKHLIDSDNDKINSECIIEDGTISVAKGAFGSCNRLKVITIPDSVVSIAANAFNNCNKLIEVNYSGTQEQWNQVVIGKGNEDLTDATINFNSLGHSHSYSSVVTKQSTCKNTGVMTHTCICGYKYTETIEKKDHIYESAATAPTCAERGYTTYTCECGYSYIGNYIDALGHTDGEWFVTKSATLTETGTKTLYCSVCSEGIDTETIPMLKGNIQNVFLSDISLNYKSIATITPEISADEGAEYTVEYISSNTNVAKVDDNGNIIAKGRGTAAITCTVTDENGNTIFDTCVVTVKYSWWQWIIIILLFGWIWY